MEVSLFLLINKLKLMIYSKSSIKLGTKPLFYMVLTIKLIGKVSSKISKMEPGISWLLQVSVLEV